VLVDLIVAGFLANHGRWPVFDYLEGELDAVGLDAWSLLEGLPRFDGMAEYSVVRWPRRPGNRPAPEQCISLTVLGLYHAREWREPAQAVVFAFLAFVRGLADWRRSQPRTPGAPRELKLASSFSLVTGFGSGMPGFEAVSSRALYELMDGEPATWSDGGSFRGDGDWERGVRRSVMQFADIEEMQDYVTETVALLYVPPAPRVLAAPSPLALLASLDYLDVVWRLAEPDAGHLFELRGAQRTGQLAFAALTQNEFDSRLTTLAEILRTARAPQKATQRRRDKPLSDLATHLVGRMPGSERRIRDAIDTLHLVIDVRDSSQHVGASGKGAAALAALGIGYPPGSWPAAWDVVSARTIEALDAIREELATLLP